MTTSTLTRSVPAVAALALGAVLSRRWWDAPVRGVEQLIPDLPGERGLFAHPDGSVAYRARSGVGRPLVMVHGWGGSADVTWWRVLGHLPGPFVAVDLPGHGASDLRERFSIENSGRALLRVMDGLEIEDALVIGYSLGGPVALQALRAAPGRCSGLIGLATSLYWRPPRTRAVAVAGPRLYGDRWSAGKLIYRARSHSQPELAPYEGWNFSAVPRHRTLVEAAAELRRFDARRWAPDLGIPTAWAITSDDGVIAASHQRTSARLLGARTMELPVGHACTQVAASKVAEVLAELAKGL